LGFLVIAGAHREFVKLTVTHEPSLIALVTGKTGMHEFREAPKEKYVGFSMPWTYLKRNIRPPRFYVAGKSHVLPRRDSLRPATRASFWEEPMAYLKWNLVGKFSVSWNWANAYHGDI
jgi:hypothetical protein